MPSSNGLLAERPQPPDSTGKLHVTGQPHATGQPVWHALPDELQLILAREAMLRAASTLADQAELLAFEMECGTLTDRGGPDALRLFAAIIRATNADTMGPVGNA